MSTKRPIRRALISVYDKTGLEDFARELGQAGVQIVSTGSTAQRIAKAGVAVTQVEELTGFPECLEGRVKTLHPRVHAGILADVRKDEHAEQLKKLGVEPFDLVVVNLYPFSATVARGAGFEDCIEKIDIGGPSMVRAAAKNHANVAVVVSADDYAETVAAVHSGGFTLEQRTELAARAFAHTAQYDAAVAGWFASQVDAGAPEFFGITGQKKMSLRYGENPHQKATVYTTGGGLAAAKQLHGKEMSYNNYHDTDAAVRTAYDFDEPAVAIIKHANPCGVAVADTIELAHRRAHACDPVSAFGGVIATNRPVTAQLAEQIVDVFTEVVAAPTFDVAAVEVLRSKKNIRLLELGDVEFPATEFRQISGGVLVQDRDVYQADGDQPDTWTLAAGHAVDERTLADLVFAWKAVRSVKSNAIVLAKDAATVGIGMGQVNRVDSARLAVQRAGDERARGAVAASDAFFPFADGLEVLLEAGVQAVVQPGGSVRDEEVIAAADKAGVALYLTGTRHFFH